MSWWLNPSKSLVIAFFGSYWATVLVLLLAARDVVDQVAGLRTGQWAAELAAFAVFTALLAALSVGVVRGWRWTFWLIFVVFLAGLIRVPAAVLELTGRIPAQGPSWYVFLVAGIGFTQFVIALVMLAGYRKAGAWGAP